MAGDEESTEGRGTILLLIHLIAIVAVIAYLVNR
jgi:hypothetical protein